MVNAQYTGNFQTNVISGIVSNWVGSYVIGSNTFADALLIQNGGVLSNGCGRLGCRANSSNNSVRVVDSGIWKSDTLYVGDQASGNSLMVAGGSIVVTGLTVGADGATCSNLVQMDNGNVVVTNATADAVLEVRGGNFILNGGVVEVDRLVITNAGGHFIHNGGTLKVGNLVLDPNLCAVGDGIANGWKQKYGLDPLDPKVASEDTDGDGMNNLEEFEAGTDPTNSASTLRIISIGKQGCDVVVAWEAGGGRTNVLQAAQGPVGAFFNISPNIVIPSGGDVVTNCCDEGAATNTTCRVYRVAAVATSAAADQPPTLAITSPADGSYVTNSVVVVEGTSASEIGIAGVDVNGLAASSTNGYSNWVGVVTGLAPGTNTLTVLAGDNAAPADIATNSIRVINAVGDFDGNGDGLPDAWQIQYFGSVDAADAQPTADPDGDGLNNLEEYRLGTNPTNPDTDGNGISDGPLAPPGSGLMPGPDPDLVVVSGGVCYPFSGVATVSISMLNSNYGLTLCPLLQVSLNSTMSPSTVLDTTGGLVTYTLPENYSQPTGDIYLQYADADTNALGGVIHKTFPAFFEPNSARSVATVAIDTNLAVAASDTNSNWWATCVSIFTTMDHAATNYVRNTNCWAYGFDLTCVAAYNSYEWGMVTGCCPSEVATRRGGTLISPRHVIFANHYSIPDGTELRFVANDNTVVSRVLSSSVQVPLTDLRVGVLNSDVPTNLISFAKVLPSNYTNYFPNSLQPISSKAIPALCLNQDESALESDIATVTAGITFASPTDATRKLVYEDKTSGDSGQPSFVILNGQLVILTVWTYGGTGSGWFITQYLSQINSAMTALGGGYSLTPVDLSPFVSCNGSTGQAP